jgi:hypothetical protein
MYVASANSYFVWNNLFVLWCMRGTYELLEQVLCYVESLRSWLLSVWFENPRDFMDYRSYMGSSLRIRSLRWLFLDLCSYNLDGFVIGLLAKPILAREKLTVVRAGSCVHPSAWAHRLVVVDDREMDHGLLAMATGEGMRAALAVTALRWLLRLGKRWVSIPGTRRTCGAAWLS